jgi:hydrogenase nickel incorporation protein HypB
MSQSRMIQLEQDILAKNNAYAAENRGFSRSRDPRAEPRFKPRLGQDNAAGADHRDAGGAAEELRHRGRPADLGRCRPHPRDRRAGDPDQHRQGLPSRRHMVGHALEHLAPSDGSVVFIENVGNLVCPAAFDLGEAHKVAILSVTEGEDKPLKYPDMFAASDLVLLNKTDLLPHLDFDVEAAIANARKVNPAIKVLKVSARTGEGMDAWLRLAHGGARHGAGRPSARHGGGIGGDRYVSGNSGEGDGARRRRHGRRRAGRHQEAHLVALLDEIAVGDYVLVHVGYALHKVSPEEAPARCADGRSRHPSKRNSRKSREVRA